MKKVEGGVLLTKNEASMIKDGLSIGRNMKSMPFEDHLYCDWKHECDKASKMWHNMDMIGISKRIK